MASVWGLLAFLFRVFFYLSKTFFLAFFGSSDNSRYILLGNLVPVVFGSRVEAEEEQKSNKVL